MLLNMLAIKLKRVGKKKQASFRVIVSEKRSKVRGRYVEDLGFYNPHTKVLKISDARVKYWISHGAQPTPTVHNLLVAKGVISGAKIPVHKQVEINKEETAAAAVENTTEKAEVATQ
jgi:small subunit ribosomal protein S16